MQGELVQTAGLQRVDAFVLPNVCPVATVLAEFEIVDVRRSALLEYKDQLVTGAIERPHPAVVLDPDA